MHCFSRLAVLLPLLLLSCGAPGDLDQAGPTSTAMPQAAKITPALTAAATVTSAEAQAQPAPTDASIPATAILPLAPDTAVYLRPVSAAASSFDATPGFAPSPDPMNSADGDMATRWAPQGGLDNQWIYFDLGKIKTIDRIRVSWEEAYATDYELQVSDNAQDWTVAAHLEDQDGGFDDVSFEPRQGRYVRMLAVARKFPEWGTSIWELEIYGPAAANPEDRPYVEVFTPSVSPTPLTLEPPLPGSGAWDGAMHAGVNYTSWSERGYLSTASDETLAYLAVVGVNAVALVPTWYQDDLESDDIEPWSGPGGRTPDDAALANAINTAHHRGMRVLLKPHLDLRTNASRVQITDPGPAWFADYRRFITHYARLAETYNVELFAIGTELDATIPGHASDWQQLIREVRAVYSGPLTYAANWPDYSHVPFWGELDFIGIDAYWPVTGKADPSEDELFAGWRNIADSLAQWYESSNLDKPLIFTELGYRSAVGANMQFSAPASSTPAPEQQAAALRAATSVMTSKPWFKGLYYWNYLPEAGVSDLTGYTIRGKPAEPVLFEAYRSWDR